MLLSEDYVSPLPVHTSFSSVMECRNYSESSQLRRFARDKYVFSNDLVNILIPHPILSKLAFNLHRNETVLAIISSCVRRKIEVKSKPCLHA
jgi:hypothetical protein